MSSRFCKVCEGWHDLNEQWPRECYGHYKHSGAASIQVIKDIEPYAAVAVDVATGKRPRIAGRRQHREFLKRNGYVEVASSNKPTPRAPTYNDISPREIVHTIERLKAGYHE